MASRYSVIRYYPDPVNGECVNIGVFAWDIGKATPVLCRMIKDFSRAMTFDPKGGRFIPEWCDRHETLPWTVEDVERGMHYMSCIQFSQPCASTLSAEELLVDMIGVMLVEGNSGQS